MAPDSTPHSSPSSAAASASRKRPWLLGCGGVLLLALVGLVLAFARFDRPLPEGMPGPEAEALAREMMDAAAVDAWHQTGAVAWNFAGRQQHLWDRQRQLARVRFDEGEAEVLLDLTTRRGRAYRNGEEVSTAEAAEMVEKAWAFWCNDSFWLNPIDKLFDQGTERARVDAGDQPSLDGTTLDGRPARGLLVTYTSGGVTPGDSYLWWIGDDGLPDRWQMWTRILPLGGVEATWEDWIELSTGARIATRHATPLFELVLSEVVGARDLEALAAGGEVDDLRHGVDPFAPLVEGQLAARSSAE